MMERWTILPSPSKSDPRRYALLVKAEMTDIQAFIRQFGAICGRPRKERSQPRYNYSLYLHDLTPGSLAKIRNVLTAINPQGRVIPPPPSSAAAQASAAEPAAASKSTVNAQTPSAFAIAEALAGANPPVPDVESVVAEGPPSRRRPGEPFLWGATLALDPSCTFESLIVGPFNRFAHAAGMAVVANPGTMYNPLFLYGVPGVGKTHILTAVARSIQEAGPRQPVFFTTGPRLSRAVLRAVVAGKLSELEDYVKKSKAIMIDDIHLLAASESIQPTLASLLDHYFKSCKHVGMTSVYPPRALDSLEKALNFRMNAGWSVEMKPPSQDVRRAVLQASLGRTGFQYNSLEVQRFEESLSGNFHEIGRWTRRLKALARIRARPGRSQSMAEIVPFLFSSRQASTQVVSVERAKLLADQQRSQPVSEVPSAKSVVVFFPKGHEEYARLMTLSFHEGARKNGLELPTRQGTFHGYDPNQLYGIPFALADLCDQAGADAVLMLGPAPGTGLGNREGEFYHALEHILGGLNKPLGWVPLSKVHEAESYLRAILDLYPAWNPES